MGEVFEWIKGFSDQPVLLFGAVFILSLAHMFVPPIPLESIVVFGSYMAGSGHGNAFLIWLSTTVGMTVGSFFMYWLAKSQGEKLLQIKWVRNYLPEKYIDKARIWFRKYEIWAIFIGKCIAGMSFAVVFCCGLFKLEQRRTLIALFLANALYYGVLVVVGRYVGLKWDTIVDYEWNIIVLIGVGLIVIAGIVFICRTRFHKKIRPTEEETTKDKQELGDSIKN
jgi:membrane protein DedA with SNARE-associated domain